MGNYPKQETKTQETTKSLQEKIDRRNRWDWVEASVWTDSMLAALEIGVKGGKWFSLIDKVYGAANLESAWQAVKRNKGAAGVDRVSIARYNRQSGKYLSELSLGIKNGTYRPQGVRREYIPKADGKKRPLGIPTVNDRVAQGAVKQAIEPIFEKEFLPMSYGFRPNRGAKDALREVDRLLEEGYTHVVDADIQAYFDTISHDRLMTKLELYISDGRVLDLVRSFLKQKIMEENKNWIPTQGTPQGGVLSPLLANLFLHDLDSKIVQAGYKMIRYADDFVILTKSKGEALTALALVQDWMVDNELRLHPEKTHVCDCMITGQGFEFLGYRFEAGSRWVRQKSILNFREKIRAKTCRVMSGSLEEIIENLNRTLRGWFNYFKHVNKYTLNTFDAFVRRRLRAILCQRHKQRGFGRGNKAHQKWPNEFFVKHGLFTMERARVLAATRRS